MSAFEVIIPSNSSKIMSTRRRQALGDISNNNPPNAMEGGGAAVLSKPRNARSSRNSSNANEEQQQQQQTIEIDSANPLMMEPPRTRRSTRSSGRLSGESDGGGMNISALDNSLNNSSIDQSSDRDSMSSSVSMSSSASDTRQIVKKDSKSRREQSEKPSKRPSPQMDSTTTTTTTTTSSSEIIAIDNTMAPFQAKHGGAAGSGNMAANANIHNLPIPDAMVAVANMIKQGRNCAAGGGGGGAAAVMDSSNTSSSSSGVAAASAPVNTNSSNNSHCEGAIIKRPVNYDHVPFYIYPCPPIIVGARPQECRISDPAHCNEIIHEMYEVYYSNELTYSSHPYMHLQADLNPKMRSILIDWLVDVHHKFKLSPMTLWLTVNIIDRYLKATDINRSKLQLVGISALLISAKFEESQPPEVTQCVKISDDAYKREEILEMETKILKELNYDVCVPTVYHFLVRYLNSIRASELVRNLASYYAERNLQEYDLLSYAPHIVAASAVFAALAQNTRYPKSQSWNETLQAETGCELADILPCCRQMIRHVGEEAETASKRKLNSAKKKYATLKYLNVASLPLPQI